jgi:hypothetical protein
VTKAAQAKTWTLNAWADGSHRSWPEPEGPAWLPAVGQWGTIPDSTLDESADWNSSDYTTVVAYSGGIINTVGVYIGSTFVSGTWHVICGQGHSDGSRFSVYAFGPMESDSPAWHMLRDAPGSPPTNTAQDGSGNPVARHTYNTLWFDPVNNRMGSIGGIARATDAGTFTTSHYFDFTISAPMSNSPWGTLSSSGLIDGADFTAYDPATHKVWYHPYVSGAVGLYDVASNTHTSDTFKSPSFSNPTGEMSALDTELGIWGIFYNGGVNFFRTNNGVSNDYYVPSTSGTAPTGAKSVLYDPVDKRFVVWNGNGRQLFYLTPPATNPYAGGNAWVWSSDTASGDTPSGAAGTVDAEPGENGTDTGTYGRFALISGSGWRAYTLLNRAGDPIYAKRVA